MFASKAAGGPKVLDSNCFPDSMIGALNFSIVWGFVLERRYDCYCLCVSVLLYKPESLLSGTCQIDEST